MKVLHGPGSTAAFRPASACTEAALLPGAVLDPMDGAVSDGGGHVSYIDLSLNPPPLSEVALLILVVVGWAWVYRVGRSACVSTVGS